ncbi:hypothetical protein CGRA01v4_09441 [Colletotrichum graminicola]|nr:hypothetical protein CGRA01v4_09441 [Colletotrichum graminicola]
MKVYGAKRGRRWKYLMEPLGGPPAPDGKTKKEAYARQDRTGQDAKAAWHKIAQTLSRRRGTIRRSEYQTLAASPRSPTRPASFLAHWSVSPPLLRTGPAGCHLMLGWWGDGWPLPRSGSISLSSS